MALTLVINSVHRLLDGNVSFHLLVGLINGHRLRLLGGDLIIVGRRVLERVSGLGVL